MPALTSTEEFLSCLRRSELWEETLLNRRLADLSTREPLPAQPDALAARLVRDGILTQFQARQLLQGKWRGFLIGGRYRMLELLGVGGMGKVFLCEHIRMKTLVALKVLPPDKLTDPAALERFNREARAAANLAHPNLVRAFDVDNDGAIHFLVMEYVHGSSLQHIVDRTGPLSLPRTTDYIRQAALGLQYAHEAGLVHRDIKPGNLLVDHGGTVKILDMGLARFFHDTKDKLTEKYDEGSILGTADYLSPEQAVSSHHVDIRADIYSLGATFYFLLAGQAPFEEGTLAQKMVWHQLRQPDSIRAKRSDVPAELEAVLLRMMAKDPEARFQQPLEVAAALKPWTQDGIPPPDEAEMPTLCPAVQALVEANPLSNATSRRSGALSGALTPLPGKVASLTNPNGWPTSAVAAPPNQPLSGGPTAKRSRWLFSAGIGVLGVCLVGMVGFWAFGPSRSSPSITPTRFDPYRGIDRDPNKPIDADLAVGRVGFKRVVRLTVAARLQDAHAQYLYSRNDPNDPNTFAVAIPLTALDRFRGSKFPNPYENLYRQSIYVEGNITYHHGRQGAKIEVTDPKHIRLQDDGPPTESP